MDQKETFLKNINVNVPVFFTKICYADVLTQHGKTIDSSVLSKEDFLLVTGIADTHHLVAHLKKLYGEFEHLEFQDHHSYTPGDARLINDRAGEKIILTTEKDFAKLAQNLNNNRLYCLTIELDFEENLSPSLNFIETSFDLFESEKFNFKPREDYMMPMPFVNTDAIVLSKKIKL